MNCQVPQLLSSSSREISQTPENVREKNIGCMSGIFRLVSKYNKRRRFLTSGKTSSKPQEITTMIKCPKVVSCDVVLRSPTLPAELRSVCPLAPADKFRSPLAVVAAKAEIEEKRRRLIGALEKCDEDLKALKKMVEVVRSLADNKKIYEKEKEEGEVEEASPAVSMVEELSRSALCGFASTNGEVLQQRKKKPGEEDIINTSIFERKKKETVNEHEKFGCPLWNRKAMEESVNEVRADIDLGQRREIGRIGIALQDYICRALIEETVREIGVCCFYFHLPLESCKRRLSF